MTPLSSLTLGLAFALPLTAAAQNDGPVVDFVKDIKHDLSDLKDGLKAASKDLSVDLATLLQDVQGGAVAPEEVADLLAGDLDRFQDEASDALTAFSAAIEDDAADSLNGAPVVPGPFLVGEGLLGKTVHQAGRQIVKTSVRAGRGAAWFGAGVQKHTGHDIVVDLRAPVLPPFTPSADAPSPEPRKPFRIDVLVGGSHVGTPLDGQLNVGGSADTQSDPQAGGDVTVTIERPGSAPREQTVPVSDDGRWQARFDDLREGNYAISATRGGVTLSDSLGIR